MEKENGWDMDFGHQSNIYVDNLLQMLPAGATDFIAGQYYMYYYLANSVPDLLPSQVPRDCYDAARCVASVQFCTITKKQNDFWSSMKQSKE